MGTSLHSTIFATMRDPAMILNSDFKFVDVNQSYCTLVQMTREDLIGQDFMDLFMSSPAEREFATKLFQRTLAGERTKIGALPFRSGMPSGDVEDRIWQAIHFAITCEDTGNTYLAQRAEDITEREAYRKQRDLVTAELNHRVRNALAVVQSVADHTGEVSPDISSFLDSFNGRLAAISRNFAALTDSHWQGLEVENIIQSELEPYAGLTHDRIEMQGPALRLNVRASKFTSMILHELTTNASKHGFLTVPEGRLSMRWWVENGLFCGEWWEQGMTDITRPDRFGFGFQLFDMLENIDITHEFLPTGLKLRFSVPVELSIEGASTTQD
jgi:PAS domain S-box-containing protein